MEGPITKEIVDESLRTLILHIAMKKITELDERFEKEEICKIQRLILGTPLGLGGKVDLSGDGISEFIISHDAYYAENNEPHLMTFGA